LTAFIYYSETKFKTRCQQDPFVNNYLLRSTVLNKQVNVTKHKESYGTRF